MNVSELWGEKNLQDLVGSLPFPKDRLKVLHSYQNNKVKAMKERKNRLMKELTLEESLKMVKE